VAQFPNLPEVLVVELDLEADSALAQEVQKLNPRESQQLRGLGRRQFALAVETQHDFRSAELP
jgi:hypothetical protein